MITGRHPAPSAAVALHYDALDRWYREVWGEHVHHGLFVDGRGDSVAAATWRLVEHVADHARVRPGSMVADVGCGYGATGRQLIADRGAAVVGFTLSQAQASYGAAQQPRVDVRVADWGDNDLPDAACDAVVAIESISHMPDKRRAFAQCARVLRPGGRLVVCDWLARARRSRWRDRRLLEPICVEGRLPSMHTAAEYGALMQRAGLRVESFEDRSRQVSRTWTICLSRGLRQVARDPDLRRFLLAPDNPDRRFALTMVRIMAAYATRAMVYGVFVAQRER